LSPAVAATLKNITDSATINNCSSFINLTFY
jgi:hypothetical protein